MLCYLQDLPHFTYIIQLDLQENMFAAENPEKIHQTKTQYCENAYTNLQNKQAQSNEDVRPPVIKVQFGADIVFTLQGNIQRGYQTYFWLWGMDSPSKPRLLQPNSTKLTLPKQTRAKLDIEISEKPSNLNFFNRNKESLSRQLNLYSEDQIGLLKKELEFKYRGYLSKSTEIDTVSGLPMVYRFRCKSSSSNFICPFLHTLNFENQVEGKRYYKHNIYCSDHFPQCTLDQENIQYNMVVRKIDSSMQLLQNMCRNRDDMKPKEMLEMLAKSIGQKGSDFIYEGLKTKNMRRSIKKYFDNAVAKAKSKQQKA